MKIIGTAGIGDFLCVVSDHEIAQITGAGYPSNMKTRPGPGQEVKVSELWQALSASRERKAELTTMGNRLRDAAKRIDTINAALEAPIIEVKE